MRGGVVVGAQGDGGRWSRIPENGCERWSLVLGTRRIGDRVVVAGDGSIRCDGACARKWDGARDGGCI